MLLLNAVDSEKCLNLIVLVSNNWVLLPFFSIFIFYFDLALLKNVPLRFFGERYWKTFLLMHLFINSLILRKFIVNARLPNVLAIYYKNVRFLSEGKSSGKCFKCLCYF